VEHGPIGAGGGGAFRYPGSHDITVLTSSSTGRPDGSSLHVIGGTVPKTATRVVISNGAGVTTDATLVAGGTDPARQYFGGFLSPSSISQPAMSITIVAYDAAGHEVGRSNPPPS
jgi:hypothetical protein